MLICGLLLSLAAPQWAQAIGDRVSGAPGVSTALGFAGEVMFAPALFPARPGFADLGDRHPAAGRVPFLGAALTVVWVAGFTATAGRIGARMRGQSPGNGGAADVFFAFIALASLTIVGHVPALGPPALTPIATVLAGTGFFVKYVAWTVGLGAAISAVVRGRPHAPPPPLSLPQLA